MPLASFSLDLPDRDARVLRGYTLLGRTVDVVETSRGCTFDCSFCSIIEMRGRNFHPYPFDRVLATIDNGLVLLGIPEFWRMFIQGAAIVLAATADVIIAGQVRNTLRVRRRIVRTSS